MHGSTNESPIKLNVVESKFDTSDLFTNKENLYGENPTRWFLGHQFRESTIIKTSGYK